MTHKSGFVNIIGNPNVGKSTIMNALVGEKLSIITYKAQTTRHRIMGILNGENFQIVYSDTPGILQPHYKLQASMMKFVDTALEDADVFLLVTEVDETFQNEEILKKIKKSGIPVIMVINKIDLAVSQQYVEDKINFYKSLHENFTIIPISAINNFNLTTLLDTIIEKLPEGEPYYSKDDLTDRPVRFFVSEIIRGKILLNYQKEIPYSVEIAVESYKEKEDIDVITATIFVTRESQKGIIIGHRGEAIKKMGTEARMEIEEFIGKKAFLDLRVKVKKDWRDDDIQLKNFGYIS